jgi:hypothetical protein
MDTAPTQTLKTTLLLKGDCKSPKMTSDFSRNNKIQMLKSAMTSESALARWISVSKLWNWQRQEPAVRKI